METHPTETYTVDLLGELRIIVCLSKERVTISWEWGWGLPLITMYIYIILLYPDERRPTTVRSNDTLVDTPFQLISGFFHVNQGILCSEHAEQASSRGVLERGGGGGNNRKWIETD